MYVGCTCDNCSLVRVVVIAMTGIPAACAAPTPLVASSITIHSDGCTHIFSAAARNISGAGFPLFPTISEVIIFQWNSFCSCNFLSIASKIRPIEPVAITLVSPCCPARLSNASNPGIKVSFVSYNS